MGKDKGGWAVRTRHSWLGIFAGGVALLLTLLCLATPAHAAPADEPCWDSPDMTHFWGVATCVSPKTCAYCGTTSGSALGHSYGNWTTTQDATCTTDGSQSGSCLRAGCSATTTKTIAKLGHNFVGDGCVLSCSRCSATDGSHFEITKTTDPTCTTSGKSTVSCSVCKMTLSTELIPSLGHNYTGSGCVQTCTRCSRTTGSHDWVDATCTEAEYCDGCGAIGASALGHDIIVVSTGNAGHREKCSRNCGLRPVDSAHMLKSEITQEVGCVTDGIKHVVCEMCDYEENLTIYAEGHKFAYPCGNICNVCGDTVGEPSHNYTGKAVRLDSDFHRVYCKYECGASAVREHTMEFPCSLECVCGEMNPLGSAVPCVPKVDVDCTSTSTCKWCGRTIPGSQHNLKETAVKEPSCTEEGLLRKECNRCDFVLEETLPKLHDYVSDCDEECDSCGEKREGLVPHHPDYSNTMCIDCQATLNNGGVATGTVMVYGKWKFATRTQLYYNGSEPESVLQGVASSCGIALEWERDIEGRQVVMWAYAGEDRISEPNGYSWSCGEPPVITFKEEGAAMDAAVYGWFAGSASPVYGEYEVDHYLMDGDGSYSKEATSKGSGQADTSVTVEPNTYSGYKTPPIKDLVISAEEVKKVKFEYPAMYTIYYDGNGNTGGTTASSTHVHGDPQPLTSNGFVKTGYQHLGWSLYKNGATIHYSDGEVVSDLTAQAGATVTLRAEWKPITYVVSYHGNGADGGGMISRLHTYDVAGNLDLNQFTRTGYEFAGWNTEADGSGISHGDGETFINLTSVDGEQVSLYAQWESIREIKVEINHYLMKINLDGTTTYELQDVDEFPAEIGDVVTLPVRAYAFYISPSAQTMTVAEEGPYVVNYYYERQKFTVTLLAGEGIAAVSGGGEYYWGTPNIAVDATVQPDSDYLWSHWSGTLPSIEKNFTFEMPASDVALTALAELKDEEEPEGSYACILTWNAGVNGGTINSNSSVTTAQGYNERLVLPNATPVKSGYTFLGWFTAPIGGKQVTSSDTVLESTTFYAQYSRNHYFIEYVMADGSLGADAPTEVAYDEAFTVSVPSRQGYVFTGWNITGMDQTVHQFGSSNANHSTSTAQSLMGVSDTWFRNLTAVDGAQVTFTATWAALDVELTGISLMYKDELGELQSVTNFNAVPFVDALYVYHTYRNNSGIAMTVDGYAANNKMVSVFLGAGASATIQVGILGPSIGFNAITGSVFFSGQSDASNELDASNNARQLEFKVVFDLELAEVYLADKDGNRLNNRKIVIGEKVYVHYVYQNNSRRAVPADIYFNGALVTSVDAVAPMSVVDVVAAQFTPLELGNFIYNGSVYRKDYNAETEIAEPDLYNNRKDLAFTVVDVPGVDILAMEGVLRMDSDVFTSFTVNNSTDADYTPEHPLTVVVSIYGANDMLLKKMSKSVIVPANSTQLVWFRWTVPSVAGPYRIESTILNASNSVVLNESVCYRDVLSSTEVFALDTYYESNKPFGWNAPSKPGVVKDTASWTVWEYQNGAFKQVTYGITVSPGSASVTPESVTAFEQFGRWNMKAGYGFGMEVTEVAVSALNGCQMPSAADYTTAQWAYAVFPEFGYATSDGTSMELVGNTWLFSEHERYGRIHFTPIWYPDSNGENTLYYAKFVQTDIWTPVGVLTVSAPAEGIFIEGDIYDDWYTN